MEAPSASGEVPHPQSLRGGSQNCRERLNGSPGLMKVEVHASRQPPSARFRASGDLGGFDGCSRVMR
ncbi:Uncharacterized protein DAT39_010164 [Clarias magur]|uniref:Uncharacterized protein n=1 Tax=Clarias magur TaxID=1594786 RepID=A0A8J4X183_CLAMG|nr:Uncharacterized protein DAT39_010164 [Clarias magur]